MTSDVLRPMHGDTSIPLPPYAVVIPAHNAARYLADAIRSAARQRVPPSEIVVVDDGSTDATSDIAKAEGATLLRVPTPGGPAAARNRGVAITKAPYVAFLDADDEWLTDHAALLMPAFQLPGVVFVGGSAELFGDAAGTVSASLPPDSPLDISEVLLTDNPVIQSSVIVERASFDSVKGYDESLRMSEDYDLWHRLSEIGRYSFVSMPTIRRRIHAEQATQSGSALLQAGWKVRRTVLERRRSMATPSDWASMLVRVDEAARADVAYAVWSGSREVLSVLWTELDTTDAALDLGGRFSARHRRPADAFRCTLRRIVRRITNRKR